MGLLSRILGGVFVLDVRFREGGTYELSVWRCTARGKVFEVPSDLAAPENELKKAARGAVAVTVGGHGVITKPVDSALAAKVLADPGNFVCSETDGMLSLVRRDGLVPLLEELAAASVYPLRVECDVAPGELARRVCDGMRWRDLMRLSEANSALAQAVARRLMVPLPGLFLLLLSVNALVGPHVQAERQELQLRVAAWQQNDSKAASVSAERQRILQQFARRPAVGYAVICSRLGACVPEGVTLTEWWMEPLAKRLEEGAELVRHERTATLTGLGTSSAAIGRFTQALAGEPLVRSVRLTSVERTREAGLQFRIEIGL